MCRVREYVYVDFFSVRISFTHVVAVTCVVGVCVVVLAVIVALTCVVVVWVSAVLMCTCVVVVIVCVCVCVCVCLCVSLCVVVGEVFARPAILGVFSQGSMSKQITHSLR